jgi:hypothetical protein
MKSPVEEILILAQSAQGTVGRSSVALGHFRHVRVYAEWGASVSAGAVTVRHRRAPGMPAEDAGVLNPVAGKANSLRLEGPIGQIEAEITTAVVGGTVTVLYIAGGS